ncbi:transporter substrate-binding domain-containing protein [Bdellovibrio bacteriovorus]|uniref:substrate-binding periplasmic protein n=1 Tax=Bdellovibrio bacteriovorus TaxID=959 RepID=UPI0021D24FDE|nr:transporter substrate-binding domain-containing protein [Bdellovibrio bacteriovorus]UXR63718.1 transporter substrate-binding domain-containing protein [Bdellovibrio bacteriovorus]
MRLLFQIVALLCCGSSVWAESGKMVSVAFTRGRPPYVFTEKGQLRGIEIDLTREVLTRLGYKLKAEALSPYRIEAEAKHGKNFDVVIGAPFSSDGARFYSKPLVKFENVAVVLKSKKIQLKSVKDMNGLRVGAWVNAGDSLGRDFHRQYSPRISGEPVRNYKEFSKQDEQFRAFWEDKIDVLIMDRYIFGWFRMTQASDADVLRDVETFSIFPDPKSTSVAFGDQKMRSAFELELGKMRESGEYDRIVQSYVGEKLAAMFKTTEKTH